VGHGGERMTYEEYKKIHNLGKNAMAQEVYHILMMVELAESESQDQQGKRIIENTLKQVRLSVLRIDPPME
jgi:hypothetical protein